MSRRLIYVVGPSGAGKDSLLAWLRLQTPNSAPVHWARRTINRPQADGPDSEKHEVVDDLFFDDLLVSNEFAMHWNANSHRYGIRKSELIYLDNPNYCVLVNGSRAHLPIAANLYPDLTVLHITADTDVLRQRLCFRARESEEAIEARLRRAIDLDLPTGCSLIEIHNNNSLDTSGQKLLEHLKKLSYWPKNASQY
jgi:ribose 1,5-bisphosphokinase